ncbi:hypothetical protein RA20_10150 [Leisingera sp. ANG-Vp]|nr:hypothetical protein RA20_10150 [Leisingera sp. ANG-Vp]
MLYFKTSMTGDEESLIEGYRRANPAFPNQSTLDPFFDEQQFEAYRELGVHSAESLFNSILTGSNSKPQSVEEWLKRLYKTIPPS